MDYLQEQQYEEALNYLAPFAQSSNPQVLSLLAYTYYQSGNMAAAAEQYNKVLQQDSNHLAALQYLAAISMQQESYRQAVAYDQRIVKLKPASAAAWKQLSFAAFAAQLPDSAFVWLQQAYRLNAKDPKVTARLAEEWIERKNYPLADSIVNAFMASDSSQVAVLGAAAKTSYYNKQYARTIAIGGRLMSLNVSSPGIFLYVVVAGYTAKKYEQCILFYEYLKAANTASESITYYTALAYTSLKQYEESNTLLQQCIAMAKSPNLENYYSSAAHNYEQLQLFKPAIAYLDTAWYIGHRPLNQYSIGRIYETAYKNDATALKYYKRYVQLYKPGSNNNEEKEIYDYLKKRMIK